MKTRRTFQPKSRAKPFTNQSYDHMQGIVSKPEDHPAYNLPDPTGRHLDPENVVSAPGIQDDGTL